jgi:DHA1 family multidrug resistance protein-like MFS transporter
LSDRVGHRIILLICAVASAVFYLPYSLAQSPGHVMLFQALTGAAVGGMIASLSATMARLSPEGRQGAVYGVDTSVTSFANAVAPMMGAGLAVLAGLRATFILTSVVFIVASLFVARLIPKPAPISVQPR